MTETDPRPAPSLLVIGDSHTLTQDGWARVPPGVAVERPSPFQNIGDRGWVERAQDKP